MLNVLYQKLLDFFTNELIQFKNKLYCFMGQQNSKSANSQLNHFSQRFIIRDHPNYQKTDTLFLLHQKLTNKQYVLAIKSYNDSNERIMLQQKICKKLASSNPNITTLQQYIIQQKSKYCSEEIKCYILFSLDNTITLKQRLLQNKCQSKAFTNEQLLEGINSVINALAWLKFHNHPHKNINSQSIYIKNNDFILADPWISPLKEPPGQYPSPENLMKISDKIETEDSYTSDIFSLGMVILQCLFGIPKGVYRNNQIQMKRLALYIENCEHHQLRQRLKEMLLGNVYQRQAILNNNNYEGKQITRNKNSKILSITSNKNNNQITTRFPTNTQNLEQDSNQINSQVQKGMIESRNMSMNNESDSKQRVSNYLNTIPISINNRESIFDPKINKVLNKTESLINQKHYPYKTPTNNGKNNSINNIRIPSGSVQFVKNTINSQKIIEIKNNLTINGRRLQLTNPLNNQISTNKDMYFIHSTNQINYPFQTHTNYLKETHLTHYNSIKKSSPKKFDHQKIKQTISRLQHKINDNLLKNQSKQKINQQINQSQQSLKLLELNIKNSNIQQQKIQQNANSQKKEEMVIQQPITSTIVYKDQKQDQQQDNINQYNTNNIKTQHYTVYDKNLIPKQGQSFQPHHQKYQLASHSQHKQHEQHQPQAVRQRQPIINQFLKSETHKNLTIPEESDCQSEGSIKKQISGEYVEEYYENGCHYKGYVKNGKRSGEGTFFYKDGGYYQGHWKNNVMNGYGSLYYENGRLAYEGYWCDDQFHGRGKVFNDTPTPLNTQFDYFNFQNIQLFWEYYQGDLVHDSKEGYGKIMLSNGQSYQGQFKNDKVQGRGVFKTKTGRVIKGIWLQSKLIKQL